MTQRWLVSNKLSAWSGNLPGEPEVYPKAVHEKELATLWYKNDVYHCIMKTYVDNKIKETI